MTPILIRVLFALAFVFLCYRVLAVLFPRKHPFKCASCRHQGRMDANGVMCRFGGREVFKNAVHIENCSDYEQTGGIRVVDPRPKRRQPPRALEGPDGLSRGGVAGDRPRPGGHPFDLN